MDTFPGFMNNSLLILPRFPDHVLYQMPLVDILFILEIDYWLPLSLHVANNFITI